MLETLAVITHSIVPRQSAAVSFPLRLRRAWASDDSRCALQYVDAEGRVMPAQWYADPGEARAAFDELERATGRAILGVAGEWLIVVQPLGADTKLPALESLLAEPGAELVSHRPGRRAVVRIAVAGQVRYAKALRASRVGRILTAQRFVAQMQGRMFEVAAIDRADERAGVVVTRALNGTTLHELARANAESFIAGCRAAGRALRSLHQAAPDWLPDHDAPAEAAMLRERVEACSRLVPALASRLASEGGRVASALADGSSDRVVLHRDFYDKQVMIDHGRPPGILDFDTLAAGEAALDVANMLAHLELRVLQGDCPRGTAAAAAREFLDGYAPSAATTARLGAYLDAARLRLAMLYALRPKWVSLLPELLGVIGAPAVSDDAVRLSSAPPARTARRERPGAVKPQHPCPLVFVVGCPRSGTTMLERMLDAHRDLAMTHETHWVTRHAKRRRDLTRQGCVRTDTLDALYADERFVRMAPPRHEIEMVMRQQPLRYERFVSLVFDHFRRQRDKAFVGDKSTGGYLRHIDRLREICPDARIVHLVRDGRDVCLSMLNWPKAHRAAGRFSMFAVEPVATTAAWWQWQVRLGIHHGRRLGTDAYREVRYEDLVAHPEQNCGVLCEFLGLEPDPAMARFSEGKSRPGDGRSANAAWLAPTPGLRDWRTQMTDAQTEMFEAIAGGTLADLGYERRFPRVSAGVAAQAATLAQRWEQEVGGETECPERAGVVVTSVKTTRLGENR